MLNRRTKVSSSQKEMNEIESDYVLKQVHQLGSPKNADVREAAQAERLKANPTARFPSALIQLRN